MYSDENRKILESNDDHRDFYVVFDEEFKYKVILETKIIFS